MNNKIKQFAEEAELVKGVWAVPDFMLERFAKLIVRECMLLCSKVENDDELGDYAGGFKDGALLCYQEILTHLGIEQ